MKKAFTLIELLVVISIIALLLSIMLPGLRAIKQKASMINCLSNQKNLAVAFIMYAGDNEDRFCSGFVNLDVDMRTPPSWVLPPLAYTASGEKFYMGDSSKLCLEYRLNGIREGALYPYLKSTDMYHCPGDKRLITGNENLVATGVPLNMSQVYRSYGMPDAYMALDVIFGQNLVNEKKLSNIKGSKLLFVEDQYDGYFNVHGWSYLPQSQTLWDPLGNYHHESCTFSFVDGHAENYKWRDDRTMIFMSSRQEAAANGYGKGVAFDPPNIDLDWLDEKYPFPTRLKGGN